MLTRRLAVMLAARRAARPHARRRRPLFLGALAAVALAAAVALPAVPAAADIGIVFGTVSGNGTGDLTVTVASDNQLASITVHLWSDGNDVLDLTDFTDQSKFITDQPQTYVLANPQADLEGVPNPLPPGTYTATADATDNAGSSVSGQSLSGTFSFLAVPSLSISPAAFTATAPSQTIPITGMLSILQPLASSPEPWADQQVTITQSPGGSQWTTALTDASGSYSISVPSVPGAQYTASVSATSTSTSAASPPLPDEPQYAPTYLAASAANAPYGKQVITGTLQYQPPVGLNLLAAVGITVTATAPGPDGHAPYTATATTLANGTFTMSLPPIMGTTTWQLTTPVDDQASNPFLAGAITSVSATQQWPSAMTFTASLSPTWTLTVGGCLASTMSPGPEKLDTPSVEIQYAPVTAHGPGTWKELGTVGTDKKRGCTGAGFVAAGWVPYAGAYYRAYFPGDSVYAAATSKAVKASLTETRFGSFTATPHSVRAGKDITISGTLQYHTKAWHGYARQEIVIIYAKSSGAVEWTISRRVRTNSKGAFRVTLPDTEGTEFWSANYDGNKTHRDSGAPSIKVTVRGRAAAAHATSIRQGPLVIHLSVPSASPASPAWPAA